MRKSKTDSTILSGVIDAVGGLEACQRLSHQFHMRVEQDSRLREIFPKDMTRLSEHFAMFLCERMGGPADYTTKRGKQSLICRHAHLSISTDEADRWLGHMFGAIDDVGIDEPARQQLREHFVETAKSLTDPFLPLYRLPLEKLKAKIIADPSLLEVSPAGHSLLRDAVSHWDAPRAKLLLEAGSDPNSEELLGHGPLYRAVNSSIAGPDEAGKQTVQLLILFGADINKPSGPGKSTPLHMTARRGHVFLAEVLIGAGADIEIRDSKGETPLRRAVNCGQEPMVNLLLNRGANPFSLDNQRRSPHDVVRHEAIRQSLDQAAIKFGTSFKRI